MDRRLLASLAVVAFVAAAAVPRVFAHGEAGDEPFLKNLTSAFFDVSISPAEVQVGEAVTVTGKVKILETWPYTLQEPGMAAIVPVVPGPVFALQNRTINGQASVGSFFAEKGGIYEFKMTLLGKEPGRWHVHPGLAVKGTGTLIGPGDWVTVRPGAGKFEFPVTLLTGETIELNTYGGRFVWWWSFLGFVLGVVWMLYWTLMKRTVTNLAVTSQLSPNDDAPDIGLITPRDHMWMNVIAGLAIILLVVGWTYATRKYPVRWVQQTDWISPPSPSTGERMAEVHASGATFDDATDTLIVKAQVKNLSKSEITVRQFIVGMATFVNGGEQEQSKAGPRDFVGQLAVEPNGPIVPGETKDLTLTISSRIFSDERLVPVRAPQQFLAGVVRFAGAEGREALVTMRTSVVPTQFRARYLP
jgi:methane/ammonia monooxygenase subunit B